jgi:hypothetical protein
MPQEENSVSIVFLSLDYSPKNINSNWKFLIFRNLYALEEAIN